jgi:6-phospho-beta-glucosidase
VQLEHVGLNHLSWERKVTVDGTDRLPELIAHHADALAAETELPVDLIRLQRAVPSYYLRYYYFEKQVLEELRGGRPRAEEVMEIERGLLEMYADPALEVKPKLLEERGGAFYSEASAMLIESLYTDRGDVQVVNVRNEGAIPNLDDDAVVEVPCRIDASGATPLPLAPLAPEMHGLVQHAKAYERLAVQAAVSGDRRVAAQALMANPLVRQHDVAQPLLDALLGANREYLPRFFGEGVPA